MQPLQASEQDITHVSTFGFCCFQSLILVTVDVILKPPICTTWSSTKLALPIFRRNTTTCSICYVYNYVYVKRMRDLFSRLVLTCYLKVWLESWTCLAEGSSELCKNVLTHMKAICWLDKKEDIIIYWANQRHCKNKGAINGNWSEIL